MTHPVMYTKLSLKKKKKSVGIITDPQLAIFNLLLFLVQSILNALQFWYANFGEENVQLNLNGLPYTKTFYSRSQSAPRWPQIQFLARQKFFVAPHQFFASCADQLFCQNKKNKSFKTSFDECNRKNHF